MLGLRYLVCPDCGTVYARPDEDIGPCRCGADRLTSLPADPASAAYFAGELDGDARE